MNTNRFTKAMVLALMAFLLACFSSRAQTVITNDYTNSFPNNGATSDYSGGGTSVASWTFWYGVGGTTIQGDPTNDAAGDPTSGSLNLVMPFTSSSQQVQVFGTFDNQYGYDGTEVMPLNIITNISFDIYVDPATTPDASGNYGSVNMSLVDPKWSSGGRTAPWNTFMTIPAAAKGHWVHMQDTNVAAKCQGMITLGYTTAAGVGFYFNSYGDGGYPNVTQNIWIDNVSVQTLSAPPPPPPPPTLGAITKTINGLNCIATDGGGGSPQNNRYQVCTVNDNGYSFYGQNSVTYTWNVKNFPAHTGTSFQQHVFLVSGEPGQYDQASDWNMTNCIFLTVQQDDSGNAFFNFRYKTNEPGGNGMLFNSHDGVNGVTYPVTNGVSVGPRMPVCSLTDPSGAVGTWSVTFDNSTNVTMTSPTGLTTNFVFDPAAAAMFADPMSICVGGQPNNTSGIEKVIYASFAATGCVNPINDNFSADTVLDTNTWKNESNDTNGCVLLPPNTTYAVPWSLPDNGFSLLGTASLSGTPVWSPVNAGIISVYGQKMALLTTSNEPSASIGFFKMIKRQFYQLQVLLPGETAAPGTPTGKTGTPDTQNTQGPFTLTVNAVDKDWYPIPGINDTVSITSTDPLFVPPSNAAMQNGTIQLQGEFQTDGTWTVTASDVTQTNIQSNTSSPVTVSN